MRDEKNRRMEFATNPVTILNSLENMGYKVDSCNCVFVIILTMFDSALEGGDQRIFCFRPVSDDLFRQVLQPGVHLDSAQVWVLFISVTPFNCKIE